MDRINRTIVDVFKRSLINLQFSKTKDLNQRENLILVLKSLAFDGSSNRDKIVEAIRVHADMVDIKSKMLIIKLILAMVSTIKSEYKGLFDEHIVDIVFSVYAKGDDITKTELFDMREKWNPYFSKEILMELDNTIRNVDKRWPNFSERPEHISLHREKIALLNEIERLKKERDLAIAQMENRRRGNVNAPKPKELLSVAKSNPVKEEEKIVKPVVQENPGQATKIVTSLNKLEKDSWFSDISDDEDELEAMEPLRLQPAKEFIQQIPVKKPASTIEEYKKAPVVPTKPNPNGISINKSMPVVEIRPQVPRNHSKPKVLQPINRPSGNASMPVLEKRSHAIVNPSRHRPKEMNFIHQTPINVAMKRPLNKSTVEKKVSSNAKVPTPQAAMNIINPIPNRTLTYKSLPVIDECPEIATNPPARQVSQPINGHSRNTSMPGVEKRSHAMVNPSRYRPKEINFITETPINKSINRPHVAVKVSKPKESQAIGESSSVNKVSTGDENRPQATTYKPNAEIDEEKNLKRKRDQEERQQWLTARKQEEIDLSGVHFEPPKKIRCSPDDVKISRPAPAYDDEDKGDGVWSF